MAQHAPMVRVPFAPLDNPRLQHLASAKNRQNGMIAKSPLGKGSANSSKSVLSKRAFESSILDSFDGENVDPAVLSSPSKKSKSEFTFAMTALKSMPPPPSVPSHLTTPVRANMSSPRTPLTAPAGRSQNRKVASLHKARRTSAPFTRIDPPFAKSISSSLPFSLDAALSGTLGKPCTAAATIQESMPKNWFFDVYEDTPEEEAATLMEHSTLTLDLSSDDESERKKDGRGKENMPPEGYDMQAASRYGTEVPRQIKKTDIVRRKIVGEEMDDGLRSPLDNLDTEPFIPEGLEKDLCEAVEGEVGVKELFAAPVPFTSGTKKISSDVCVNGEGEVQGEVVVFEDSPEEGDAVDENAAT